MAKSERSKSIKHSEGIDRISSLPEPLLSRILSLLPTKNAVATSLLSMRWKFLWTSITNLEFDDERSQQRHTTLDMKRMKFTLFVNRVLLLLNPPWIQNFKLKCHRDLCDPLYLYPWICAAMGRTVQKLELYLLLARSMELPLTHFPCKTLAVLKLKGDIHFKIAEAASICFPNLLTLHLSGIELTIARNCSVRFPSLKDLVLDSARYTNEESVHKLFASCPSLENLIIKRSEQDNALSLIISIPSLINLSIHFWEFEFDWDSRLQIDTPALKYLYVEDDSRCCFTSNNLSSLLEARIKFECSRLLDFDEDNYRKNFLNFFGSLCNVKFLSISGDTLQVFWPLSAYIAPVFCNLTKLEFGDYRCSWCSVVLELLEGMDNLEHLVFKVTEDACDSFFGWEEPLQAVPMCLRHRVTTISFTEICCACDEEVELVRYFLKNAKVLKMLTVDRIDCCTVAEKFELVQKLLMSPRGSHECLLHVDEWVTE